MRTLKKLCEFVGGFYVCNPHHIILYDSILCALMYSNIFCNQESGRLDIIKAQHALVDTSFIYLLYPIYSNWNIGPSLAISNVFNLGLPPSPHPRTVK